MTVYIIIVSYNGVKWIEKCLKSCGNYKILVIDNASTDGTVSYIKENHPQVILLEQKTNLGFGQANNLGIEYALSKRADYVFLLNQDAYLYKNTINDLVMTHKEHDDFGVLSPIHLNGDGTKLDRNFSNYLAYKNNNFFYFDAIKNTLSKVYEIPFVNAAGWLLPKKTLLTIGGFDPVFFHYGEDDNYCQRLRYHSLKVGVVPNTFMNHDREFILKGIDFRSMKYKEWIYKLKWADINKDNTNEIKTRIQKLKNARIKFFIKFNFPQFKYSNQELKLIYKIVKDISKSRAINKREGKHYI